MPTNNGVPSGTLILLVLRLLSTQELHGYAIAQRIAQLTNDQLTVEEGSLYPALQKMLLKGWIKGSDVISETGRSVRQYRLTALGRKQLAKEREAYRVNSSAIALILDHA